MEGIDKSDMLTHLYLISYEGKTVVHGADWLHPGSLHLQRMAPLQERLQSPKGKAHAFQVFQALHFKICKVSSDKDSKTDTSLPAA